MNIRQTDSWKRAQLAVLQVVAKGETKKIRELRKRLDKENDAAEISSLISAIHALEEYMEKGKAAREKRKKDKADKLKAAPPPETVVEADAIVEKNKPNPMGPSGPKMQPRYELENGPKAGMCEACGMPMEACACMASAEACPACGSNSPANEDGSCVDCRCDKATKDALNNEKHSASPKNEKPPVEDVCPDCGADIGSCGCKNYARADADPGQMAQLVALVVSQVESYRANHANNEPLEAVLDKILQEVRQEALDTASDSVWELQHPAEQPAV